MTTNTGSTTMTPRGSGLETKTPSSSSEPFWKSPLAGAVTVVALAAFFLTVLALMQRTSTDDLTWTRSVYLLSGIEAVAFAGVGWLFGKEVHRERADNAEKRADASQKAAMQAGEQAATQRSNFNAAQAAVQAKLEARKPATEVFRAAGAPPPGLIDAATLADQDLREIAMFLDGLDGLARKAMSADHTD